jgi:hypothetical protein
MVTINITFIFWPVSFPFSQVEHNLCKARDFVTLVHHPISRTWLERHSAMCFGWMTEDQSAWVTLLELRLFT